MPFPKKKSTAKGKKSKGKKGPPVLPPMPGGAGYMEMMNPKKGKK